MKIKTDKFKEAVDFCKLTLRKGNINHETVRLFTVGNELKLHSSNTNIHNIYTFDVKDIEDFEGLNIFISIEKLIAIMNNATSESVTLKLEKNAVVFKIPSKRQIGLVPEDVLNYIKFEDINLDTENKVKINFTKLNNSLERYKDIISKGYSTKSFENYFYDGNLFSTLNLTILNTVDVDSENELSEKIAFHYSILPILKNYIGEVDTYLEDKYISFYSDRLASIIIKNNDVSSCPDYNSEAWKPRFAHKFGFDIVVSDFIDTLKKLEYFAKTGNVNSKIKLDIEDNTLTISTIGDDSAIETIDIVNSQNIKEEKYVSCSTLLTFLSILPKDSVWLGLKCSSTEDETRNFTYVSDDMCIGVMELNK